MLWSLAAARALAGLAAAEAALVVFFTKLGYLHLVVIL
jgi:hypothetical protein